MVLLVTSNKHLNKNEHKSFSNFPPKIEEMGTFPNVQEASITLIPQPDMDT